MHNGGIGEFQAVKRQLLRMLSNSSYGWMQGTTDSETIFALFVDIYSGLQGAALVEKMATALLTTVETIESLHKSVGLTSRCDLNLAVTDGHSAVVSRYSSAGMMPNSLYIHTGHSYSCNGGDVNLISCEQQAVLVAFEPLTQDSSWYSVEANHIAVINESLQVDIRPVSIH